MLNNCIIMGRLTADPELRHTNSGVACCSFTLAVERDGKPNEQTGQRAADFIDCTAWRNTAEFICKWFSKGQRGCGCGPDADQDMERPARSEQEEHRASG